MSSTTYKGLTIRTPDPSGAGGLLINNNFIELADRVPPTKYATIDPTKNNDNTENYEVGSRWYNTSTGSVFFCLDDATGLAVWNEVCFLIDDVIFPGDVVITDTLTVNDFIDCERLVIDHTGKPTIDFRKAGTDVAEITIDNTSNNEVQIAAIGTGTNRIQLAPLGSAGDNTTLIIDSLKNIGINGQPSNTGTGSLFIANTDDAPAGSADGVSLTAFDFAVGDSRLIIQPESGGNFTFGNNIFRANTIEVTGTDDDIPTLTIGRVDSIVSRIDLNATGGCILGFSDSSVEQIIFSTDGNSDFKLSYREGGTSLATAMFLKQSTGNIGWWTNSFGNSSDKIMSFGAADSTPTNSPADIFQIWAEDVVAGNTVPHIRTEAGTIIKLYQEDALTAKVETSTSTADSAVIDNNRTRIEEIEARLINIGLLNVPPVSVLKSPGFGFSSGVGVAWTNPVRIETSDDSYSQATLNNQTTNSLGGQSFGFSIPGTATIAGIEVAIHRKRDFGSNDITDSLVSLLRGGVAESTNKASATVWPTSESTATYGGDSDLWGASWSPSDINAFGFGVVMKAVENGDSQGTAKVDYMTIKVYYFA